MSPRPTLRSSKLELHTHITKTSRPICSRSKLRLRTARKDQLAGISQLFRAVTQEPPKKLAARVFRDRFDELDGSKMFVVNLEMCHMLLSG